MNNLSKVTIILTILIFCYGNKSVKNGLYKIAIIQCLSRLSEFRGCNLEGRKQVL